MNNPYYDYIDYYVMRNGQNSRIIHRCGLEEYYAKRLSDGISFNPDTSREQYYAILINYIKGAVQEIIQNKIYYQNLTAEQSANLIIRRSLKQLIGELETIRVMTLYELNKCNQCLRDCIEC